MSSDPQPSPMVEVVESFAQNNAAGKESLLGMLASNPPGFCREAVGLLANAEPSPGFRYLTHILLKHGLLAGALTDPECCTQQQAIAAVKAITQIGSPIEAELERALGAAIQQAPSPAGAVRLRRIMDLLAAISARSLRVFQSALLAHPDPTVRSRAVLLIGQGSKNAVSFARLLLDPDARVQANAVEALWHLCESESRDLLLTAAKSPHNRVAGNAAVGLYRIGDVNSIRLVIEMAERGDPKFFMTAIWAMGELEDPRFLPVLKELFARSTGNARAAVLRTMVRIRRRERESTEAGSIDIRIYKDRHSGDTRSLGLALWSPRTPDLSCLKATDFAVWEGSTLARDYNVTSRKNPPLLTVGFVAPRFLSNVDSYGSAVVEGFRRSIAFKRAEDLWRVDRYLIEGQGAERASSEVQPANLPYDDAAKTQRGFLTATDHLEKIVSSPGPRERAAADFITAVDRVAEAMSKLTGERHILLFLNDGCEGGRENERRLGQIAEFARAERIAVHGIVPDTARLLPEIGKFCESMEGGSFTIASVEMIAEVVGGIYSQFLNRFDVSYVVPAGVDPNGERVVVVSSAYGCGRVALTAADSSVAG